MPKTRYAVAVETPGNEGAARIFGTYHDQTRAEAFVARVNAIIERDEVTDRAAEDAIEHGEESYGYQPPSDLMYGRAIVRVIHPPRIQRAVNFAKGDPT